MVHTNVDPAAGAAPFPAPAPPSLTMRDVLELEAMDGARLLAGAKGLGREVVSATVIDAPDGTRWTREHEFLMTSTFPLAALGAALEPLIADLAERGISGLGVKLTRYMKELPRPVLKTADRLGFPIVSLPGRMPWIDLINPILANALAARADRLERAEAIFGGFSDSLIASSDPGDLARLLAEMVGNPVIIDCEAEGVCAWSAPPEAGAAADLLALLRGAGEDETRRGSGARRVRRHSGPAGSLVSVPLADDAGGGRIAILERNRPFDESDMDRLLHARAACSIKVMQLSAEARINRARESDLVSALIAPFRNRGESRRAARAARDAGHDLHGPHVVIACRIDGAPQQRLAEIRKALHIRLSGRGDVLAGFPRPALAALILNRWERLDHDDVAALLTDLQRRLAARFPGLRLSCGVSHRLAEPSALPGGFAQAEQARRFGEGAEGPCAIHWFEEVGPLRLFSHPAVQAEARSFVADWLGVLSDHDTRRNGRLMPTLRAFLEANGNHRQAAKRLNVHHNSVRYRIGKIRRLTGHDVLSPGVRLQYDLALALHRMQDQNAPLRPGDDASGLNPSSSPDRAPAPECR